MFLDSFDLDQPDRWLVTWNFGGTAFNALRTYASEIQFPAETVIFNEGDKSNGMYLVLDGMVLATIKDEHGETKVLRAIKAGQSFGELGLLIGSSRHATVTAWLDVTLLHITPDQLKRLEADRPELSTQVYKVLARTLAEQWMRGGKWIGRGAGSE